MEHDEAPSAPAVGNGVRVRNPGGEDGVSWGGGGMSAALPGNVIADAKVPQPELSPDCDGVSAAESEDVESRGGSGGRRDLRVEASSLRHVLLHVRKSPHFDVCKDIVVSRRQNRRRVEVPEYMPFGDMITICHINTNALIHNGLCGERKVLVVSDLATGYLGAFPVLSKTSERVGVVILGAVLGTRPCASVPYGPCA